MTNAATQRVNGFNRVKNSRFFFFYIAYGAWTVVSVSRITYIASDLIDLSVLYYAVPFFLLLHELCYNNWSRSSLISALAFFFVVLLGILSGTSGLLSLLLILYCARYVPLRQIAVVTTWLLSVMLVLTLALAEFSIITNEITYRGSRPRNGLGFIGRTYASYFVFAICAFYAIAKHPNYSKAVLIALVVVNAWVFIQSDTRNGFVLTLALVFLLFFLSKGRCQIRSEIWGKLAIVSFPLAFLIMAGLSAAYSPASSFLQAANQLVSYRLLYAHQAFSQYAISLFGTAIPWNELPYIVDCSYLRMILDDGIVGFAVVMAVEIAACVYASRSKNPLYIALCILYSVHFAFDPVMSVLYLNPIALMGITGLFQSGQAGRETVRRQGSTKGVEIE